MISRPQMRPGTTYRERQNLATTYPSARAYDRLPNNLPTQLARARCSSRTAFFGHRRLGRRRLAGRSRELRPDAPERSDARWQRIAIVFDDVVQFPKERRRLLVGEIQFHGLQAIERNSSAPTHP
jgi:hypothetical protein